MASKNTVQSDQRSQIPPSFYENIHSDIVFLFQHLCCIASNIKTKAKIPFELGLDYQLEKNSRSLVPERSELYQFFKRNGMNEPRKFNSLAKEYEITTNDDELRKSRGLGYELIKNYFFLTCKYRELDLGEHLRDFLIYAHIGHDKGTTPDYFFLKDERAKGITVKLLNGQYDQPHWKRPCRSHNNTSHIITGDFNDYRLQPVLGKPIVGREEDVVQILNFLTGDSDFCSVVGAPGMGKTEVCKAALKALVKSQKDTSVAFIGLSDISDCKSILVRLAEVTGLMADEVAKVTELQQIIRTLPKGIYYVDNAESILTSPEGYNILDTLRQIDGVRVLVSSRISLDGIDDICIDLESLDDESAVELFSRNWQGKESLTSENIRLFVNNELENHPLSIVLNAKLGRRISFSELLLRWEKKGTLGVRLQNSPKLQSRRNALAKSFEISLNSLNDLPGANNLWSFLSLFDDGIDKNVLYAWEYMTGFFDAVDYLQENSVIYEEEQRIYMLGPIARYARDHIHGTHHCRVTL